MSRYNIFGNSFNYFVSFSRGGGNRANIDEYILTTRQALKEFTGVEETKAMIVLNPADPPIIMRNTLYAMVKNPNINKIREKVMEMADIIQSYVSGFQVVVEPVLLEKGIEMAEHYARLLLEGEGSVHFEKDKIF